MRLPTPRNGLVIRFGFLWSEEARLGVDEAAKDRPCVIVLATRRDAAGAIRVTVAPITHSAPRDDVASSLRLPPTEARSLGLDEGEHWVRLTELNEFTWPGFDLRPIPGTDRCDYGMVGEQIYRAVIRGILDLNAARRRTARTERD